jgi:hypothetical protein
MNLSVLVAPADPVAWMQILRVARGNLAARVFPFGEQRNCAVIMQQFSCIASETQPAKALNCMNAAVLVGR